MKKCFLVLLSTLAFSFIFGSCTTQSPTVQEYFPIQENTKYIYEGLGNEYASFDVIIDYTSENKVQRRINNSGTELVDVIEVADGKVTRLYLQAETYFRENFLNKEATIQDVLLMEPIEVGTSWTLSDGTVRTITGVSVDVETPSGNYSAVSVENESEYGTTVEYYAKNIGLVKQVYTATDYEISSSLSEVLENTPLLQTVRFYYPNIHNSTLEVYEQEISFQTNDSTKAILESIYKENIPLQAGAVFTANTKINKYYLNDENIVCLDLNNAFLTEMNAGAEYEAMILQSIANTFGSYYQQNKVLLTIDDALYSSGHFEFVEGEYLTVNLDSIQTAEK